MSNTVIFWTQVGSAVAFLGSLFVLYRVLVEIKDATIQKLKEQIASLEDRLAEARAEGPDVLAERYAKRTQMLSEELKRLSADYDLNAEAIKDKEEELLVARDELATLQDQMDRARELMGDFFCPHCRAPMLNRMYRTEVVEHGGRALDVDHEFVEYECGLALADGAETHACEEVGRQVGTGGAVGSAPP